MAELTIASVSRTVFMGYATLTATMSDGTTARLFSYYIDELSFDASELVGLTIEQACDLRHKRDVAYLRS
jgi:hypothetical protein